jgi:lysosomal Pro-X carboxypeptidase
MWACATIQDASNGVEAFQKLLYVPGQCLNISDEYASSAAQRPKHLLRWSPVGSYIDTNGWDYLSCTEEVHPIGSNNVTDFLPPSNWSLAQTTEWCQYIYGSALSPRPATLPTNFGFWDLARFAASTSRLIFSSGSNDPWMAQSITKTLSPSLPAIIIDQGAHHSDLGGAYNPVPTETDVASLVNARQFEIDTINSWLQEAVAERKAAKAWAASSAAEPALFV